MYANTLKDNEFTHNNTKYSVWVQDGFKGVQMAGVYKEPKIGLPVVGTTFGKMASFTNDILPWAKRCIEKNF